MDVKCYNKKCLYVWDYRGKDKKFVCCPKCRFKRILDKCRSFFLGKSLIKSDRPTDRPNDIQPKKAPVIVLKDLKKEKTAVPGRVFFDQFGERVHIKRIPYIKIIRTIPRDPIKLLEHQRSFL